MTAEGLPHDFEPGEYYSPMQTEPMCRVCGMPKNHSVHDTSRRPRS